MQKYRKKRKGQRKITLGNGGGIFTWNTGSYDMKKKSRQGRKRGASGSNPLTFPPILSRLAPVTEARALTLPPRRR